MSRCLLLWLCWMDAAFPHRMSKLPGLGEISISPRYSGRARCRKRKACR